MTVKKKVMDKQDFSNTLVTVVLVMAIFVSVMGTLIMVDSFSSTESIMVSSNGGTVSLEVVGEPPLAVDSVLVDETPENTLQKPQ